MEYIGFEQRLKRPDQKTWDCFVWDVTHNPVYLFMEMDGIMQRSEYLKGGEWQHNEEDWNMLKFATLERGSATVIEVNKIKSIEYLRSNDSFSYSLIMESGVRIVISQLQTSE